MVSEFKSLLDTKELWLPAITGLLARLSASRPGRKMGDALKERLTWLKAPESEKAFWEAFSSGAKKYSNEHGHSLAARSVARIMTHCVQDHGAELDLAALVDQIFAEEPDDSRLSQIVSRQAVVLEDALVPQSELASALSTLIRDYLRPAFRAHPYFTQQVGFRETASLLREIRDTLAAPPHDLSALRRDYRAKIAEKYEVIPMQGISPKVQNRTIGIRMKDIFIPLTAKRDWPWDFRNITSQVKSAPIFAASHHDLGHTIRFLESLRENFAAQLSMIGAEDVRNFTQSVSVAFKDKFVSPHGDILYSNFMVPVLKAEDMIPVAINTQGIEWEDPSNVITSDLIEYVLREPVVVKELFSSPRIVVQGDPGCGKSTLLRYVAWALASGDTEIIGEDYVDSVPIFIRAIEFGEALEQGRVESLEEYLADDAARFAPLIKSVIASGSAVLLLDGLDEVSKAALRGKVKERVDDFIADPVFAQNRIVITTRTTGYERTGLTGQFRHFVISDLTDEQISTFVQRWYGAIQREVPGGIDAKLEAGQLMGAITGNAGIHRMARNPLLLTIIALIKWQGRALPELRILLYDAAAQTLIRSWPLVQRRVEFDELFVREWLAPVAFHILSERTGDLIDEYSLMEELVVAMKRLKSKTEIEAKTESRELLDSISQHSGILLPRDTDADGRNLYGFLHQTFAEFLAAYLLAGRWEDEELKLRDFAHDPYWREVLLLMAGHLGTQRRAKAGQFIQAVRCLESSAYESVVHRDLLLAGQILGDGVPAGPAGIIESLLSELLSTWLETPIRPLRQDVEQVFQNLRGTEYAPVLARLAVSLTPSAEGIITLARLLGATFFKNQLEVVLGNESLDKALRLDAAALLAPIDPGVRDQIYKIAADGDERVRFSATRLLADEDPRGIDLLRQLLATSRAWAQGKPSPLAGWKSATAVESVALMLKNGDPALEANSAALLMEWDDKRGPAALPRLALITERAVADTVWTAVRDAKPGPVEDDILRLLLESPSLQLRLLAAHQLAARGNVAGTEALVQLLTAPDISVRLQAAIRLDEGNDPRAIPAFVQLLDEIDEARMFYVLGPLARRGHSKGLTFLSRAVTQRNPTIRVQAASLLLEMGDMQAQAILVDTVSAGGALASHAFQSLVKCGKVPLRELAAKVLNQPDLGLAWVAMEVLALQKEGEALEVLTGLLDDGRLFVRAHAAELLLSREEPMVVEALAGHLGTMVRETELPAGPRYPAPVCPPAESAYNFIKRHLAPSGVLPEQVSSG